MKGSILILLCFIGGCALGYIVHSDYDFNQLSVWILYLLMFQIGLGIGSNPSFGKIFKKIKAKDLLIPIGTIGGALLFSCVAALCIKKLTLSEILAINYGCGYYSLSSLLINQFLASKVGATLAAKIATIALLSNIIRELIALIFAPFIAKYFGKLELIGASGVASTDVCLPVIKKWNGENYIALAIVHGVIIDVTTPFFISLFCDL